jgi:AcrR family transcriptional regulator
MEHSGQLSIQPGRQTRRALVESEILEKAARLFAQRGYAATSLEQVASELGLQRSSLYHYFPGKEDLLGRLVTSLLTRSEAALERIRSVRGDNPVPRLEVIIEALLEPIFEAPNRFKLLLTAQTELPPPLEKRWHDVRQALVSEVRDAIRDGTRSGKFRVVDIDAATFTLLGMCNWVAWWPATRRQDTSVVAKQIAQVAISGLGQPPPTADGDSPQDAIAGIRSHLERLEAQLKGEQGR